MSAKANAPRRRRNVTLARMPDGSGVLLDAASGTRHALSATAVEVWERCDGGRTSEGIVAELVDLYDAPLSEVRESVVRLLACLDGLGVLEVSGASDQPHRRCYDLLGFRVEVSSNSAQLPTLLDRLNSELGARQSQDLHASYVATASADGARWDLTFQGQELRRCDDLVEAATFLEWHMCERAIEWRQDLLHVHGAALAEPHGSLLIPGGGGIGKTTLALALALRGLRLLSDDVVFIRPDSWEVVPFGRSFHLHDDAIERLVPLGLRYDSRDRIGDRLCASVLGHWEPAAGPHLRHVLLPRRADGPSSELQRVSDAEVALELLGCSMNLRRFPGEGIETLRELLSGVDCYALRMGTDLGVAAQLIRELVVSERETPGASATAGLDQPRATSSAFIA